MNTTRPSPSNLTAYFIAVLGALLIIGVLVWAIQRYASPPPLGANRAQERHKNLAEMRNTDATLNHYGWVDQGKGFVRLPISDAMNLTIKDYQNPDAAKKEIAVRVDKLTFVPPPPPAAPAKPNPYE
ncbi:MAG TPA: hypothetical protein VK615_14970 [Candidatus Binatia bacterium]|nr:hypothetical protein [Candidatus Binatia bacterium]